MIDFKIFSEADIIETLKRIPGILTLLPKE